MQLFKENEEFQNEEFQNNVVRIVSFQIIDILKKNH